MCFHFALGPTNYMFSPVEMDEQGFFISVLPLNHYTFYTSKSSFNPNSQSMVKRQLLTWRKNLGFYPGSMALPVVMHLLNYKVRVVMPTAPAKFDWINEMWIQPMADIKIVSIISSYFSNINEHQKPKPSYWDVLHPRAGTTSACSSHICPVTRTLGTASHPPPHWNSTSSTQGSKSDITSQVSP